jgi:hypothetical protein
MVVPFITKTIAVAQDADGVPSAVSSCLSRAQGTIVRLADGHVPSELVQYIHE